MQNSLIQDFHKGRNRNAPCPCGSGKKAKKCDCEISLNAKHNVKQIVYDDIQEAVMTDAEVYAQEFKEELEKDGVSFDHLVERARERIEKET
jgi:hypothetical protein